MAAAMSTSVPYPVRSIQEEVIKKPHLSFEKWGFKISLPYLPSGQGDWGAYFWGDDNRMGENVNVKSLKIPVG